MRSRNSIEELWWHGACYELRGKLHSLVEIAAKIKHKEYYQTQCIMGEYKQKRDSDSTSFKSLKNT